MQLFPASANKSIAPSVWSVDTKSYHWGGASTLRHFVKLVSDNTPTPSQNGKWFAAVVACITYTILPTRSDSHVATAINNHIYVYQMSVICLRACAKMHVPIAEGAIVQTTTETPFSLFYVRHIDWVAIYHLRFIFEQEINKDSQQPSSFRWHSTDLINIVHFSVSVYWRARGACSAHCKRHDKNDLFHPLLFDA